jgi:hypothetical protein
MTEKLHNQINGTEWSWKNLNTVTDHLLSSLILANGTVSINTLTIQLHFSSRSNLPEDFIKPNGAWSVLFDAGLVFAKLRLEKSVGETIKN